MGKIKLHSLQIPKGWDKKQVRNNNDKFMVKYADLQDSPTFIPATYAKTNSGFYIKVPV